MSPHDQKELSRFMRPDLLKSTFEQLTTFDFFEKSFYDLAEKILINAPASADRSAALRYLRLALIQIQMSVAHDWVEKDETKVIQRKA